MKNNSFKVWCKDRNEWEKDYCALDQYGQLFQVVHGDLMHLKLTNHCICKALDIYDCNKVVIYDGSIIEIINKQGNKEYWIVEWDDTRYIVYNQVNSIREIEIAPYILGDADPVFTADGDTYNKLKVCGHIFENPELVDKYTIENRFKQG